MKKCFLISKFYGTIDQKEILVLEEQGKINIDKDQELIFLKDESAISIIKKYIVDNNYYSDSYELYYPIDILDFIQEHCYDMRVRIGAYTEISSELRDDEVVDFIEDYKNEVYNHTYDSVYKLMKEGLKHSIKSRL